MMKLGKKKMQVKYVEYSWRQHSMGISSLEFSNFPVYPLV